MVKIIYSSNSSKALFFFSLLFLSLSVAGQPEKIENISKKFSSYNEQTLQEKIFIHTDRSSYVAGEIIWFKVYCTDVKTNQLSSMSKVAYVEVLDKDQQSVLQGKIALKDGTGSGSFAIPISIRSGNFLLRSYTNWMKNFDPEYYFHQNLTILNTIKAEVATPEKTTTNYDVQFFPEGGNLVNGLKSKVAFRVTDNSGKGIDFNGTVVDETNDTLVRFRPVKFGIGTFSFTPQKGKRYKAFIKTKNENFVAGNLPIALNNGLVLYLPDATPQGLIKVNIQTTTDDETALLVINNNKKIVLSRLLHFEKGKAELQIDRSNLDEGISSITVFNGNNQPVAERLFFNKPRQQKLIIGGNADQAHYGTRKKVKLSVVSEDESAMPQSSDMSMAVYLLDSLPLYSHDIYNYFWLSSELKGVIESPSYYLDSQNDQANEAIDNLMLTHGWRRFKWEDVLESKMPAYKFLPEYEGHLVSGRMVNKLTEKPGANILGFLSVPGPLFHLYAASSASDGSLQFNTRDVYGSRLIVAQSKNPDTASAFRVDILSPFSDSYSTNKIPSFTTSQIAATTLLKRSINMQVHNVYAGDKLNSFQLPKADTLNFYGKPLVKYMLDDYVRFPTMEEVLREYVREINVRNRKGNFFLTNLNKDIYGLPIIKEPVILLDGVPQFDNGNKITHYDPLKVQKLEVIEERYFLGPAVFDGIASFSTYNGDLEGFRLDTANTVMDYDALQMKREFYSPVYQTPQEFSSRLPDFRTLLYWSPDIKTDNTGKKEITFYTSDLPGRYAVVLQGISKKGKAGSKVFTIDVTK